MSKERPILFSAQMVRALLDGRKTQTRRVVKLPKEHTWGTGYEGEIWYRADDLSAMGDFSIDELSCSYGQIGDRLWVREAWRIGAWNEDDETISIDYLADNHARREWLDVPLDERNMFERLWIQSTNDAMKAGLETDSDGKYHWEAGQSPCRGRPSIHMPRWASRINLEITNVRVERLNEISTADALAEGITHHSMNDPRIEYQWLWESINGAGSWDANPWVWVIEFKRVSA